MTPLLSRMRLRINAKETLSLSNLIKGVALCRTTTNRTKSALAAIRT